MKRISKWMALVFMSAMIVCLTGCGAAGKKMDFEKLFSYRVSGFNGFGMLNVSSGKEEDLSEFIDLNDKNNLAFLTSIDYSADRQTSLFNGDKVQISVAYDKELAKKAGIRPVHDSFSIQVSGLPEMITSSSALKGNAEDLKADNLDYLQQTLNDGWNYITPASFSSDAEIDPDSLRYLGSAIYCSADSGRPGSSFVSLYSGKLAPEHKYEGQYCYLAIWIPQSSTTGNFDSDNLYLGDNFEKKMAASVDQQLFGIYTLDLLTSSAQYADEHGQLPDESLLINILDQLYSAGWTYREALEQTGGSYVSSTTLSDAFSKTVAEQDGLNQDIRFETGQTCYALTDLNAVGKEYLTTGATPKQELKTGDSFQIVELYRIPKNSYSYGDVYGRIGDDAWVKLETKKLYSAVPENIYNSLIQKDSVLMKDEEKVSPYDYPTDPGEAEWIAENEPETDESGNLTGDYILYICTAGNTRKSIRKPNIYDNAFAVNEYEPGSEIKVYEIKEVDYQGTFGRIGKNEWILLGSIDGEVFWQKK